MSASGSRSKKTNLANSGEMSIAQTSETAVAPSISKKSSSMVDVGGNSNNNNNNDETVPFTTIVASARPRRVSTDEGTLSSKSVDMTRSLSDANELIPTSQLGAETRELYTAMRGVVPLKTRMSGFFRHARCFVGSDFVECAARRFELPSTAAAQLLTQFEHAFVVRCLAFDKKDFGKTLYRFIDDEKPKDRRDLEERNVKSFTCYNFVFLV